jgi:hypothetical protein
MDDTRSPDVLDTSSQKVDLSDHERSNEPQKEAEESVHKEMQGEMKALYIILSELLKDVAVQLDLESLEESERIRKLNEMIEQSQRPK